MTVRCDSNVGDHVMRLALAHVECDSKVGDHVMRLALEHSYKMCAQYVAEFADH